MPSIDVFISYARQTQLQQADEIAQACQSQGLSVFLDRNSIGPGSQIPQTIAYAIENALVVLVLADNKYFERPYCLLELQMALDRSHADRYGRIAVALGAREGVDLSLLPPSLRYSNWPQVDEVTAVIRTILARRKPPSAPAPEATPAGWGHPAVGDAGNAGVAHLPPSLAAGCVKQARDTCAALTNAVGSGGPGNLAAVFVLLPQAKVEAASEHWQWIIAFADRSSQLFEQEWGAYSQEYATIDALFVDALVEEGRVEQAVTIARRLREAHRRGIVDLELMSLRALARVLEARGRPRSARVVWRRALDAARGSSASM